jgi:hypothetical protein
MDRREFLASSVAASALAVGKPESLLVGSQPTQSGQSAGDANAREFYVLERYHLVSGPQQQIADNYFRDALVPALNRQGIAPVGVFNVYIGPETPITYISTSSRSLEALVAVERKLGLDADYVKAAAPFLEAPAKEPAFIRMERSLMQAFENTRLTVPAATTAHAPIVFELRTYESATYQDHIRKVEMMTLHEGAIFAKAGVWPVFYGDTIFGSNLPALTYLLGFESVADREKKWGLFLNSPEWKSLSADPRYSFERIISNITNIILTPAPYSQI